MEGYIMEKILNIEEIEIEDEEYSWDSQSGYAITTDKQVIKLLIDSGQRCCERWGYFMSEDDLDSFIGSNVIDISITDTALNTTVLNDRGVDPEDEWFEGNIMFVNINTDRGVLQFTAYNMHNGYYGHQAHVISEQLEHSERL
jgi:hypothetical protein